jgi:hypothetical protein
MNNLNQNIAIETLKVSLNVKSNLPYKINISSIVSPLNMGLTWKKAVQLYPLYKGAIDCFEHNSSNCKF